MNLHMQIQIKFIKQDKNNIIIVIFYEKIMRIYDRMNVIANITDNLISVHKNDLSIEYKIQNLNDIGKFIDKINKYEQISPPKVINNMKDAFKNSDFNKTKKVHKFSIVNEFLYIDRPKMPEKLLQYF